MMGTQLLRGRGFTAADGPNAAPVVLIAASTANRYWPDENPLGKHVKSVNEPQWRTVIGVVADVRHFSLTTDANGGVSGTMYMPYAQSVQADRSLPAVMNLVVKTSADPARIGAELRALAMAQGPNLPISRVEAMEAIVAASIAGRRSTAGLFLAFAIAAVILASVGIYGVVSHSVSQRTYEIGVRMAIGATRGNVVAMILRQGLSFATAGLGVGLVFAIGLTRFLSSLLYGVSPTDPLTFALVSALLLTIAVVSSGVPAWRARIDPTKSLRTD
jgi:putative ABC transport system permease protein